MTLTHSTLVSPTVQPEGRARFRRLPLAALTLAAVAIISACGGGGSDTEDGTATASDTEGTARAAATTTTWTKIATEGQSFNVSGVQTVRYGASGHFVTKSVSSTGKCSNSFFGSDPAVGTKKECDLKSTSDTGGKSDLADPAKKEIAMELVSSAENSSLDWRAQYAYIEDIKDGRGYTAGIIGFCSGTGDMLELVQNYTDSKPGNVLAKYLPALRKVNGSSSHSGLDPNFTRDWKTAAKDSAFQKAQDSERDTIYFNPAVNQAKADGLRALGQFIYYDAIVMHGPGEDSVSFGGIRKTAMKKAKTPAQGGNETTYLNAFLDARKAAMLTEAAHDDTSRVDTEQRKFLKEGNLDLNTPLSWKTYGDPYTIK
jgi:chitosanase